MKRYYNLAFSFPSAAFRMLGEIAHWHKRDPAKQALYQAKVVETRRRITELRKQKAAEVHSAVATSVHNEEAYPMPELKQPPEVLAGVPAAEIITVVLGYPAPAPRS